MDKVSYDELSIIPLSKRYKLDSFCSTSVELNDFLKNNALKDQENLTSRTYLCFWKRNLTGFITLVADTLEVQAVNDIDRVDDYPYRRYPCVKIARLAVDRKFEKRGIGRFLLLASIGKVLSICDKIGCRFITVDSKPESIGFYEKHNFKVVEMYRHNEFPKMYLDMRPIVEMMQPEESLEKYDIQ